MQVSLYEVLDDEAAEALWGLYEQSFDALRTTAVQRHLMDRDEFDAVITDKRVVKHVVTDDERDGRAAGLMAMTNDLDAVPLVSPDYFHARWPEHFRENLIWYITFLAVHPDYQGTGAIAHLIGSGCAAAERLGGVIAADICQFNEDRLDLPVAIGRLARTFTPSVRTLRLDAQTYWAYEFPTPASEPV